MRNLLLSALMTVGTMIAQPSHAQSTPDVLVLGDSQISFGAGAVYLEFFNDLPRRCSLTRQQASRLGTLGPNSTAAIGVRSTSLNSWVARSGSAKGSICDVDQKYGVNAGVYGIQGNNNREFVQIGRGQNYQFCAPNTSAFEAMFAPGNYQPKLLVLAFLGNSAERWMNDPTAVAQDVQRTIAQIPHDVPCVFMTTVPVFEKATNDPRMRAQIAIVNAFEQSNGHCKAVAGFTPEVRAAIEGQPRYFRRNDAGRVADPLHPRPAATRLFLELNTPKLCDAVKAAIEN